LSVQRAADLTLTQQLN